MTVVEHGKKTEPNFKTFMFVFVACHGTFLSLDSFSLSLSFSPLQILCRHSMNIYKVIQGDLMDAKADYILQQNNCLGVKPHGLSAAIASRYPYADPYTRRRRIGSRNMAIVDDRPVPGTIKVYKDPEGSSPTFISLFAQYGMGRPFSYNNQGCDAYSDTAEERQKWFASCLDHVALLEPDSVAIPFNIGCGLAFGNWSIYEKMIRDWTANNPSIQVTLYKIGN